jgi:hypothetical protein
VGVASHLSDKEFQMAELSPLRRRMIEDMTVRNMSPAVLVQTARARHIWREHAFGRSGRTCRTLMIFSKAAISTGR